MLEIVIVDDAKEDALLAERVLRVECKIQNPVTLCTNGKDATEFCNELHQGGKHFLVFLDLIMSPVSGLEFLRSWQSSGCARSSIVIMLSGLKDIKAINEGYQLGAKTFILKPVTKGDVVQMLNSLNTRITIEQDDEGYWLSWFGAESARAETSRKGVRVLTMPA